MSVVEQIVNAMSDDPWWVKTDKDRDELMHRLDDPQFAQASRVHEWRNYVPDVVQKLWPQLSLETRIIMYMAAENAASNEEWD